MNGKTFISVFISFLLVLAAVEAKSAILVVKNATDLSELYEKKVLSLLNGMGYDVTIIDRDVPIAYPDYDVIVVAGRPTNVGASKELDDSIVNIPVNSFPSVVIDGKFLDEWGWTRALSAGTTSSFGRQKIVIQNNSVSILKDYSLGDRPFVHVAGDGPVINIRSVNTQMNVIASSDDNGNYAIIAIAEAGQELYGVTPKARIVFFGVSYSIYWTEQAEIMFKESVKWVSSDLDADGVLDYNDNCANASNADQLNSDNDFLGDLCDACPNENSRNYDANNDGCIDDSDKDGIKNDADNCPFVSNVDQSDRNKNGRGDKCDILPGESVELDVDSDGNNETATNKNGIVTDGYELYEDPNSNTRALVMDGDKDGMTDFLIDIKRNDVYDKYWDPDNELITDVAQGDTDNDGDFESLINVDNSSGYEKVFDGIFYDLSDLLIESVAVLPESPGIGGDVAYNVSIVNSGQYNASNFVVSFYHNDILGLNKTITLPPNKTTSITFNVTNLASGNHRLKAAADSTNKIIESNEQNNNATTDVFVPFPVSSSGGGGGGSGGSRFVPSGNATINGISPKVEITTGNSLKLSGSFVNNYNYDLRDLKLFLRGEGLDTRWYTLQPDKFDEVKKGETKNFELTFNMPTGSKIYTYSLILKGAAVSNYGTVTIPHEFKLQVTGEAMPTTTPTVAKTVEPPIEPTETITTVEERSQPTGRFVQVITSPIVLGLAVAMAALILLVWKFYPHPILGKKGYVWGRGWKY